MKHKKEFRYISLFLVITFLLNFMPVENGAGEGFVSMLKNGLFQLQGYLGSNLRIKAGDDKDYFFRSGNNYNLKLSSEPGYVAKDFDLSKESDEVTLSLITVTKDNPNKSQAVSGATITLDTSDEKVIKAVASKGSIVLTKLGAGSKQISGKVDIKDVGTYNFNFYAKNDVVIDKRDTTTGDTPHYKNVFSTDKGNNTLVMPIVNNAYQLKIKGYKKGISKNLLDYSTAPLNFTVAVTGKNNDETVLQVNQDTGEVTAVGAGIAQITVSAREDKKNIVKPDSTMVLVPLKISASNAAISGSALNFSKFKSIGKNDTLALTEGADGICSKIIYTNMFDPNDLEWTVTKNGKKVKNMLSFTEVRDKTANSASNLKISGRKAGTYTVTAKLKKVTGLYKAEVDGTFVTFKVTIPLIDKDRSIYMNVGDTYNIFENSSIGDIKDFTYTPTNTGAIKINNATSVIKAEKIGTDIVTVSGNGSTFKITVHVIDKVALSTGNVTIPVGGTFDITAITTDISGADSWEWISGDNTIATVSGSANQAVIKGVKAGETEVTVEHTVDGIVKKASCKVFVTNSVTKIDLIPVQKVLNVGEVTSIRAEVKPKISKDTYLYWRSSNPEIVTVDDPNNHSKSNSVTAKSPGVAVIMALNKENVVLGSCNITVLSPVSGITLSESVVERPLSDKTFQLSATAKPDSDTKFVWKSSNDKIATVDGKGLVTFKKAGQVTIICSSATNPKIMATCDVIITKPAEGLKLDTKEITIAVGETYKLGATISPDDATNKLLNYKSMDPKVASVSNNGLITGRKPGIAYIMVSTPDKKVNETCTVKVVQKANGMKLSAVALILNKGENYTLEVTFNPKNTTENKVIWATGDKTIAKVDSRGRVTAISAGETIITASSSNGLTAICQIKVREPVLSIELSEKEATIAIGDELELEAEFNSDDVTNPKVKWKSSKSGVASVDKNGVVRGKKGGVAIITATADENGMKAFCVVTVEELATEITLNKTAYNLGYHKTVKLKATLKSNSVTKKKLKWTSSKSEVASVNKMGVVYGKRVGYANIKVRATDGSGISATCRIRVVREVGSINVKDSFYSMVVGQRKKIKARINPKGATYKTPKFVSDNDDIAMVDSRGKVTAIAPGKAQISVMAKDNSGKRQKVIIRVREYIPSTGITLSNTTLVMGVGDEQSTVYSIVPNGTDDKVKWSTNNKAVARVNKNGLITAIAPGLAVITATTTSGMKAQVSVTVVGLNFNKLDLEQYDTYNLSILGDVKNVTWDSENVSIATVSRGGMVTAKKPGTTYIRARVQGALLRCRVNVRKIN